MGRRRPKSSALPPQPSARRLQVLHPKRAVRPDETRRATKRRRDPMEEAVRLNRPLLSFFTLLVRTRQLLTRRRSRCNAWHRVTLRQKSWTATPNLPRKESRTNLTTDNPLTPRGTAALADDVNMTHWDRCRDLAIDPTSGARLGLKRRLPHRGFHALGFDNQT